MLCILYTYYSDRMLVKDVSDKEWNFGGLKTLIAENIALTPVAVLTHVRVVVDGTVITMYTLNGLLLQILPCDEKWNYMILVFAVVCDC